MSTHNAFFLAAADRIGARLCRDAIWSGRRCNWLGWALDVVGRAYSRMYRAQTSSLYDGTAGIALFLGRLSCQTGDAIQRTTAIGALHQALDALPNLPIGVRSSFYAGASGIVYTTIELGALFDDPALVRRGFDMLRRAAANAADDPWLDVLGGSAGTILALVAVDARRIGDSLVDLADRHGRRILQAATRAERGWSWDTMPGQSSDHLLGYGHGASGIAAALLDLWTVTGNDEYRHGAREAFRYERTFLSREQHNWPDLRVTSTAPDQTVYAAAWCHGGPGIGMSRLRALTLVDDEEVAKDLDQALELTGALCRASTATPGVESLPVPRSRRKRRPPDRRRRRPASAGSRRARRTSGAAGHRCAAVERPAVAVRCHRRR